MSDFQALYDLWDKFLQTWPKKRLATMTLDEYTELDSQDTFIYWLKHRLKALGDIEGDALKFGVYAYRSKSAQNRRYSNDHCWHESLGETADEAFQKVHAYVVRIAALAAAGNLNDIDTFEHPGLEADVKWKVAFLYQNRQHPIIVNIFTRSMLAAFTGDDADKSMVILQRTALAQRQENEGILEFGQKIENAWRNGARPANRHNQNSVSASAPSTPTSAQAAASEPTVPSACINRIYYGPPGTGKTYTLNAIKREYEGRYSFVTFHQSYGYEEFIEGLRPKNTETGEVVYEVHPGAFKSLCRRAQKEPDQRFAMLIDEINRGNISKIFGELITLIEPDKRGMEVTLPYSGEPFSVPANVDIIGTMNTADRSLALLDTALRRRFEFEELQPNASKLVKLTTDAGVIDVPKMLERINERIEVLYDREHCIGHAYFMALHDDPRLETLANIFRNRILPLLEEYFFEDWHKIRLVLGDNQKQEAHQFVRAEEQRLAELFGNDHGLESYATKRRYSVQEEAFNNPAAYIGIYQPSA